MQGPSRCVVLAVLLYGCDTGGVDVPIDSPPVTGDSGLIVRWSTDPAPIPGDVGDGLSLTVARFKLDSLRIVGDAGPGDPRTTANAMDLRWENGAQAPADIAFDSAPPGLYSQVSLAFDGRDGSNSYRIDGRVTVGSNTYDYEIRDRDPLVFNVLIDKMLAPGESAVVNLRINFRHALDSLDWPNLDIQDGDIELDENDSEMIGFRQKLVESFEIVSVNSVN